MDHERCCNNSMSVIGTAACYSALLLLFSLQGQALPVNNSTTASVPCADGYYWTGTGCLLCSVCSTKEAVLQPCSLSTNTICSPCSNTNTSNPQYVTRKEPSSATQCKNCTICADIHREEILPCSYSTNTVCGGCLKGYFLGVSADGEVRCLACSWCPPDDDSVIKWEECQDAGLPQDMWCSPGYSSTYNGPYSSTSMKVLSNEHFLSFTHQSTQLKMQTTSSATLIIIIITLLATIFTTTMTICAIIVCTLQRCRKTNIVNYHRQINTPVEEMDPL